jgi:hypothetical protein
MKVSRTGYSLLLLGSVLLAGCQGKSATNGSTPGAAADAEAEIKASLAKLGPEDRRLAEQQNYCPVMPEVRLGEMGPPLKVVLKGEPVFVCCENCVQPAQEDPDNTLARVKRLKER